MTYIRSMSRIFSLVLLCASAAAALAQDADNKIACYSYPKTTQSFKKKLWDGYEISLGPARNGSGGDGDDCTAAIYNAAGKVVFRTTGFGVIFDERYTGQDFDGDGKPEVVFRTDAGGGAHCCWEYNVVSLTPKPHKLFDLGLGDFVQDKDGKMLIWQRIAGTSGYTSEADRPFAEQVFRVRDGKLVDVTPEFCGKLFSPGSEDFDVWTKALTPENIKKLQAEKNSGTGGDIEDEEVVSALLSRAEQRVFCHQFDEALADLSLWPEASRDAMKNSFAESIRTYSPEFAARLAGTARAK
jgi:hypothetical protein